MDHSFGPVWAPRAWSRQTCRLRTWRCACLNVPGALNAPRSLTARHTQSRYLASNRRFSQSRFEDLQPTRINLYAGELQDRVPGLLRSQYADAGPSLSAEIVRTRHRVLTAPETIRGPPKVARVTEPATTEPCDAERRRSTALGMNSRSSIGNDRRLRVHDDAALQHAALDSSRSVASANPPIAAPDSQSPPRPRLGNDRAGPATCLIACRGRCRPRLARRISR